MILLFAVVIFLCDYTAEDIRRQAGITPPPQFRKSASPILERFLKFRAIAFAKKTVYTMKKEKTRRSSRYAQKLVEGQHYGTAAM